MMAICLRSQPICYLCAKPLTEPINVDHVPPRQLFAKSLRKKHNLAKLVTINVHAACNKSFGSDEQYFVQTLLPFAHGSYSGNAVFKESVTKFHAGEHKLLMNTVLKEFERNPSGLILPKGKVAKRFHGNRLRRVAWKIVRGLYFYHFATALPGDWTTDVTAPLREKSCQIISQYSCQLPAIQNTALIPAYSLIGFINSLKQAI